MPDRPKGRTTKIVQADVRIDGTLKQSGAYNLMCKNADLLRSCYCCSMLQLLFLFCYHRQSFGFAALAATCLFTDKYASHLAHIVSPANLLTDSASLLNTVLLASRPEQALCPCKNHTCAFNFGGGGGFSMTKMFLEIVTTTTPATIIQEVGSTAF